MIRFMMALRIEMEHGLGWERLNSPSKPMFHEHPRPDPQGIPDRVGTFQARVREEVPLPQVWHGQGPPLRAAVPLPALPEALQPRERLLAQVVHCWQARIPFNATLSITGLSRVTVRRRIRRFQRSLDVESPAHEGLVEVDEAFVGRRRRGNQRIVVGAWSRTQRKAVLRYVPDREQGTTDRFLLAHVGARGTTVFTDG